ncbi:rho GTPase-activating protein gacN-like isoform X4 [Ambystoma mexicanum]|uniref:rho GTPase-activating protein gacN-like isoform X4 n=1 Tax=Ambystoma mexicanum TaxID=8296 RepID=UPI0037E95543
MACYLLSPKPDGSASSTMRNPPAHADNLTRRQTTSPTMLCARDVEGRDPALPGDRKRLNAARGVTSQRQKQRLNPVRNLTNESLFDKLDVNKSWIGDSLDRPWDFCDTCAEKAHPIMPSEDLAAMSSQLQSQAKTIMSLNQAVKRLEKEREFQHQRIQSLEEDVQRLQSSARGASDAALERKMEDLRRELSSQLWSLREQVLEIPDRGMTRGQSSVTTLIEEVNQSKRTVWKECESVRREIDQMKQKIRRQEEDLLHQISDSQESRRGHDRNSKDFHVYNFSGDLQLTPDPPPPGSVPLNTKPSIGLPLPASDQIYMLEELLDNYQRNSMDLNRAKAESQETQLELQHIKTTISNIKDEMRKLHAQSSLPRPAARKERSRRAKTHLSKTSTERKKSTGSSSEDDDSAPELSLGDISSEDISSVLDFGMGIGKHDFQRTTRTNADLDTGGRQELDSDLDAYDGGDLSNGLEELSDGAPELNFSDL